MGKKDPRIDAYIDRSAGFARPILEYIREVVHEGCPDVEETIKWGFPHFLYGGILCSMASFKAHCAFGFWKGSLLSAGKGGLAKVEQPAMGDFGRLTSLSDLPGRKTLLRYVKEAARLNEEGVPTNGGKPRQRRALVPPGYFLSALQKNRRALANFQSFNPSSKRDYVEWVTEAKREETRQRRLATAVEWLAEGKPRNWRYARK